MDNIPVFPHKEIMFAVFNGRKEMTKERYDEVILFANYIKQQTERGKIIINNRFDCTEKR